jgi:hypothetical protein
VKTAVSLMVRRNKTAPGGGGAGIAFANLGATEGASVNPDFQSGSAATSYANASWTPPTSGLILYAVDSRFGTGPNQPTVTGNGLTWVNVGTVTVSTIHRLTLFGANATGSSAGATTTDFAGQSQVWCMGVFAHVTGVDLSGGVAAAFVQVATNSTASGTSLTVPLAAAGNANNRPFAVFFRNFNETVTARPNWTELDSQNGGGAGRWMESQYRDVFETSASVSMFTGSAILGIAVELKAA